MILGKLIEKSGNGDTAALLAGADDIGALDHGLGVGLLGGLGFLIDLELGDFADVLATGCTEVIGLQKSHRHCNGSNSQVDS